MKKETKRHWYNNGVVDRIFHDNESIPDTFKLGKLPRTQEHKDKISEARKNHSVSAETRLKISKKLLGNKADEATKTKLKAIHKDQFKNTHYYNNGSITIRSTVCPEGFTTGRLPMTEEQKLKISKGNSGKHRTMEAIIKNRETHLGKTYSQSSKQKRIETKRKNGTLISSKDEEIFENFLKSLVGKNNYIAQYKDYIRYPFNCDFYIPSLNLFIELNHHWTHGEHIFDRNNLKDLEKYEDLKKRSINSKFYKTALYVWTELDIKKFQTAIKNNLNYIVSYNIEEMNKLMKLLEDFYNKSYPYKTDIISLRDRFYNETKGV